MTDIYSTSTFGDTGNLYLFSDGSDRFPYNPNGLTNIIRYTGPKDTPRNIRRQRGNNLDAMRRYGTPVILKHMYNDQDVEDGIAEASPNRDNIYGQSRRDDPLSFGIGYVSIEKSDNEWLSPEGIIIVSDISPGSGYQKAPKYLGYGPGYLTYAILPDVSQDLFKITEQGVFIRIQEATVQMGWFPEVNDNDLLVIAQIDRSENVISTRERFVLKQTSPASIRGLDRLGRQEYTEDFGNRNVTDQSFQMTLVPDSDVKMNVPIDR